MNLHEQCLLKYLTNSLDLMHSTELLKLTNAVLEEHKKNTDFLVKKVGINYNCI